MAAKMAGQTINDRLLAARHSIAGQGLAKSVCKATTEEMIGPKKKHLDFYDKCTQLSCRQLIKFLCLEELWKQSVACLRLEGLKLLLTVELLCDGYLQHHEARLARWVQSIDFCAAANHYLCSGSVN
ncbi:UNVERIFIED_CONTAM: hypothetical protein B566_EDAN018303 [Ephemera danica]|nr:hypothetical protein B566_EDAN018303 [Ephemera danica]